MILALCCCMKKKENIGHKKEKNDPFIFLDIKSLEHPNVPLNLLSIDEKGKN